MESRLDLELLDFVPNVFDHFVQLIKVLFMQFDDVSQLISFLFLGLDCSLELENLHCVIS